MANASMFDGFNKKILEAEKFLLNALNEAEKFKMELWNKYKKFLSSQKLELMIKKIEILEDELKLRLNVLMDSANREEELSRGRGR